MAGGLTSQDLYSAPSAGDKVDLSTMRIVSRDLKRHGNVITLIISQSPYAQFVATIVFTVAVVKS